LTETLIEILTGKAGLTVMVIVFEKTGKPWLHMALEVILQTITSPFTGVKVKATWLPDDTPFTSHSKIGFVPGFTGWAV
jgi:hypothetical protein